MRREMSLIMLLDFLAIRRVRWEESPIAFRRSTSEQAAHSDGLLIRTAGVSGLHDLYTPSDPSAGLLVGLLGEIHNLEALCNRYSVTSGVTGAHLLAAGIRSEGVDCFTRVDGHYCAVVVDLDAKRVIAAVDRTGGLRRIYYARRGHHLAVATHPGDILRQPWMERSLNHESLVELVDSGYVLPPRTMFRGMNKLMPGQAVVFDQGQEVRLRQIGALEVPEGRRGIGTVEQLTSSLRQTIDQVLSNSRQPAFLLSGGVDSGVLVTLAAERDADAITAYSGSFPGTPLDELDYAKAIIEACGCRHRVIDLGRQELLDDLPQIIWHLGEPTLDFSVIPTYALLREVSKDFDGVVSGDGPDHLFGRFYPLTAKRYLGQFLRWLPLMAASGMGSFPGMRSLSKLLLAGRGSIRQAYQWVHHVGIWGDESEALILALLGHEGLLSKTRFQSESRVPSSGLVHSLDAIDLQVTALDYYIDGSFGVFQKVGAMAAGLGISLHEPFLTRAVADCILEMPRSLRFRGGMLALLQERAKSKYALKHELATTLLPMSVLDKRKAGFTPPLKQWLVNRLNGKPARTWLSKPMQERGYGFDVTVVDGIARQHCAGERDWSTALFLIVSADLWHRVFIEAAECSPPEWGLSDIGLG